MVHIIVKRKTDLVVDLKMTQLKQEINLARAKLTKNVDKIKSSQYFCLTNYYNTTVIPNTETR